MNEKKESMSEWGEEPDFDDWLDASRHKFLHALSCADAFTKLIEKAPNLDVLLGAGDFIARKRPRKMCVLGFLAEDGWGSADG